MYLNSITDLNDRTVGCPPVVELKWQGMKTDSVIILPNQSRCFDAFFVEKVTLSPTLSSLGSCGVIGFLIGFAIKRVMKFLAVIVGVFFVAPLATQQKECCISCMTP